MSSFQAKQPVVHPSREITRESWVADVTQPILCAAFFATHQVQGAGDVPSEFCLFTFAYKNTQFRSSEHAYQFQHF